MGFIFKAKRRLAWLVMSLFPKQQDKVVLQSYYRRGYSDSPRAIADELLRRGGYRLYWTVAGDAEAASLPEGVTPLKENSLRSIYHQCTAGFWIDNCRKWAFVRKGPKQYYIQTWHGFPLKRIEKDAGNALPPEYIEGAIHDSQICDLFLSDSTFLTNVYHNGFWYDGPVAEYGLPRNDILVFPPEGLYEKVAGYFSLPAGKRIALYAPTFRKDKGLDVYDVDYRRCVAALNRRFGGDWVILARLHPNVASRASELDLDGVNVINASDYPDINDLYVAADAMITDYSSTMFDYLITGKPAFLYVNDFADYKNDRNFYFDIEKLPFARAEDNDSLEAAILGFDECVQEEKRLGFIKEFGINETGHSAERCADVIEQIRRQRS